jgi:hypothetical protein
VMATARRACRIVASTIETDGNSGAGTSLRAGVGDGMDVDMTKAGPTSPAFDIGHRLGRLEPRSTPLAADAAYVTDAGGRCADFGLKAPHTLSSVSR